MPKDRPLDDRARTFTRNVDWNLFRVFLEIAEAGGISAAARGLNRQQPSISAALKRLEGHLDAELVRRTAKGTALTPAGRALLEQCVEIHRRVARMPAEIRQAKGELDGTISVRLISDLVSRDFDAALAAFHAAHPAVEARLDIAPWREVVRAVADGDAEIGIACDSAPRAGLRYDLLTREVQQLYCGRGHRLHGMGPIHPAELAGEAFVLTGADEPEDVERFRRRYGLGRRVSGFAETQSEARRLVALGVGIGLLTTAVAGQAPWNA
jgi:DNA-binding transcriptional LysR family regulator